MNNWMGVLCRQQDEKITYYRYQRGRLLPDPPRHQRRSNGARRPRADEVIRTGKAANGLRARCEASLSLWANGEKLATYQDDSLMDAGGVALFADAVQRGEIVVVAFDDFVLTSP